MRCKFTPLGFETRLLSSRRSFRQGVNLPRWGLKQFDAPVCIEMSFCVNLPRWGLKPTQNCEEKLERCV